MLPFLLAQESTYRFTPFRIVLLALVIGLCGLAVIPFLSIQLNPPPRSHGLQISYNLSGGSPEAVESGITAPLERMLASIEGLTDIQSRSSDNQGQIMLQFSDRYDIAKKRLEVSARIRQLYGQFPPGASFPVIHYQSEFQTEQRLLTFAVNSTLPATELHDFLSRNLLPDISAQQGIASVHIYGAPQHEVHLTLQPEKLQTLNIQPREVMQSIRTAISKRELGKTRISKPSAPTAMTYLIYAGEGMDRDPLSYIPDLPVKQQGSRTIFVRDLGHLSKNIAPPNQYYRINGLQSVNLSISAERQANLIKLAGQSLNIVRQFESENKDFIQVFESYNAAEFLERELTMITYRSIATLVILMLFIVILYRNWRQISIIFLSLIFTLSASFLCYYLSGLSLHLYSIAGLTLSLGIILDNILIMSDHIRKKGNKRIFLAIFAATITTIGALAAIFLMEKSQRENLVDFFLIFSINLTMSLLTALYLIPALSSLLSVGDQRRYIRRIPRRIRFFNTTYLSYSRFTSRHRWVIPVLFVLLFGLPFFMLPNKIEKETKWAERYNTVQENKFYADHIRPFMDEWLGGTFRLFYNHRDRFFFGSQRREETKLFLQAQMPPGGTISQLNEVMLRVESFLKSFPQIKQFQLNISNPKNARIEILFKEDYEKTGFPYQLKDELTSFAVSAGSADFRVWGVGDAFNNVLPGERVSTHIVLTGYNFDQIWALARSSKSYLEEHPRIKQVFINSDINYYIPEDYYYYMDFKAPAFLLKNNIHLGIMASHFESGRRDFGAVTQWPYEGRTVPVRVIQAVDQQDQMWSFLHRPARRDSNSFFRQKDVFTLEKEKGSSDIVRKNQAYQLVLEYDFIGNYRLGNKVMEESIEQIQANLPVGYQVKSQRNYWGGPDSKSSMAWIILMGMLFVWILGSILFNSIRQALIPVVMIPFSYIGIFLVTHFFEFQFGQGGLASFLLVGGLSVNAVFFIINDYNRVRLIQRHLPTPVAYLKAYNGKIIPILLTALSTVLGLLPFVIFDKSDPFWYSLAVCTIGGMVASVIVLVLLLPVFFKK
ncbi:efflux RND transporter permease subunit [Membranicola marinus]|uniref:Efflux RND transporter permease subunit n=1 Tax=Membranihabitans marinus TaxID=1227546 RepID=A0A953LD14_9BACT|nr:efflux RND transporter permease subunit [Membranihabitans marinus]MBY5960086.1 efflux RND transporter permease subunit [Membranihabitans marinus]